MRCGKTHPKKKILSSKGPSIVTSRWCFQCVDVLSTFYHNKAVFYARASAWLLVKDTLAKQKEQQVVFLIIYYQDRSLMTLSFALSLKGEGDLFVSAVTINLSESEVKSFSVVYSKRSQLKKTEVSVLMNLEFNWTNANERKWLICLADNWSQINQTKAKSGEWENFVTN